MGFLSPPPPALASWLAVGKCPPKQGCPTPNRGLGTLVTGHIQRDCISVIYLQTSRGIRQTQACQAVANQLISFQKQSSLSAQAIKVSTLGTDNVIGTSKGEAVEMTCVCSCISDMQNCQPSP